jgi:fructuronate reductase
MERLSLTTLPDRSERVTVSGVDPRALSIGLVHLGIGAFHRAHQAVYTELACAATGDDRWGTFAVTGRSASVVDQLGPQDCLYGVLTKSSDRSTLRVVGGVREVASGGADPRSALRAISSSGVRVVTLTITEKGYPRTPDGALALGTEVVSADLALVDAVLSGSGTKHASGSPVGLLTAGLAMRFTGGAEPISVVSCDNLPGNGAQLGRIVRELADSAGAGEFGAWLQDRVTFPSTMVDRIVPATTDEDRAEAADLLQLYDAGLVVAEPFAQWVLEDRFAAERPAWEQAGATLAADVAPYEKAKLRLLNGTHSLLAYLGALRGHRTIAEAVTDDQLLDAARRFQREDAIPTLAAPPGVDLAEYGEQILRRFANPHLRHTTIQVAMDGSQKLPIRILGTAKDRLRAGAVPQHCALAVAAWIAYIRRGLDPAEHDLPLNDPLAATLRERADGLQAGLVDRMFGVREVFDDEIAGDDAFRAAVRDAMSSLLSSSRSTPR